ncbi:hypothetical protein T4E_7088 [Trichinella pseudospiralis]|uniref:Uncharacterized protein n=1 Tax=Trichinella pseudospiralis TaxID=6337 RepID=A0A0V0Y9G8_TRIPS|nr:hypothetical protein T4E_7088 [Trichinella pseudospiralis]
MALYSIAPVTKYFRVILSLLDSLTLDVGVLLEPVGDEPYETLKSRLLKRYGQSNGNRFNELTITVAVGDMKPSFQDFYLHLEPTKLLEAFVVCTEKALFFKELHRDGFPTSRSANWTS